MKDTLTEMLTGLRSAVTAQRLTVEMANSPICLGLAKVMKDEGYVTDFRVGDDDGKGERLRLRIRNTAAGRLLLRELALVSVPE